MNPFFFTCCICRRSLVSICGTSREVDSVDRWPPKNRTNSPSKVMLFMQKFQLVDIWRKKNLDAKSDTWANKTGTCRSRIDYWLISSSLDENNIYVNIVTTPLTVHKTITLQIKFSPNASTTQWNSYWKLNNSVLKHTSHRKDSLPNKMLLA